MSDRADRQSSTPVARALPPATHRPSAGGFLLGRLLLTRVVPPKRPI
ncbi:hypothetical protein ACFO5K_26030 [Nocardia halotolerans]|uniref:Uncharacterized protein n=1 Tax=Nocardia halotolerans TaxID=1755878 RepID=A0ABV8VQH2_9NOCA